MEKELARLKEIELALAEIFDEAVIARDSAQRVLGLKQKLGMRIMKMQTEITEAQLQEAARH